MPRRTPTPPPSQDEPRYLVVVHPYPPNANMLVHADRRGLALWLACCTGKDALLAMYYKPSVSRIFISFLSAPPLCVGTRRRPGIFPCGGYFLFERKNDCVVLIWRYVSRQGWSSSKWTDTLSASIRCWECTHGPSSSKDRCRKIWTRHPRYSIATTTAAVWSKGMVGHSVKGGAVLCSFINVMGRVEARRRRGALVSWLES